MRRGDRLRKRAAIVGIAAGVLSGPVAASAPPATADNLVDVTASVSRTYDDDGSAAAVRNYVAGQIGGVQSRDAFVFDLVGIRATITGATLELTNGANCGGLAAVGPLDTYELWDLTNPTASISGPYASGSPTGQAIYNDLGGGISYGSISVVTAGDNLQVPLNATAVAALNAKRGLKIGMGGSYAEGASSDTYVFGATSGTNCTVMLHLATTPSPQTVTFPNPGPVEYGTAPFPLTARASSNMAIDYSVLSGPCHIVRPDHMAADAAGVCTVRASQAGDDDYAPAVKDINVSIERASTHTTVTAAPSPAKLGQPVTLTATVEPDPLDFYGPVGPTGTVDFTVDGASAGSAPLASDRTAAITVAFGGGSHTVTASYSGDTNFRPSDSSLAPTSVDVPCDRTLTGKVRSVTATSGLTCISHAKVSGGISVGRGAAVDLEMSTVSGSISSTAAAAIRICGSTTGAIAVSHTTYSVVIGDPVGINGCAANKVTSGITVANNPAPVVVVGNKVATGVTAANNTGGQTINGNHR